MAVFLGEDSFGTHVAGDLKYCFSYGLSYLQSVLLVDLTTRAPCEGEAAIDPASLSSIDLVNLARHSLDRGWVDLALSKVDELKIDEL